MSNYADIGQQQIPYMLTDYMSPPPAPEEVEVYDLGQNYIRPYNTAPQYNQNSDGSLSYSSYYNQSPPSYNQNYNPGYTDSPSYNQNYNTDPYSDDLEKLAIKMLLLQSQLAAATPVSTTTTTDTTSDYAPTSTSDTSAPATTPDDTTQNIYGGQNPPSVYPQQPYYPQQSAYYQQPYLQNPTNYYQQPGYSSLPYLFASMNSNGASSGSGGSAAAASANPLAALFASLFS